MRNIFHELIADRKFLFYILKLFVSFIIIYYGIDFLVGLSTPDGIFYSLFVENNLNIAAWMRISLLETSKWILSFFNYNTFVHDKFYLTLVDGKSIHVVYSCLGFGVMSFWAAFIFSANGSIFKKIKWLITGLISIWIINVFRMALFLIAINKRWVMYFGLDNHALFNIAAYTLIIAMIYFYERSEKVIKDVTV